jgi:predicted ATP-binding protein involved in virulence
MVEFEIEKLFDKFDHRISLAGDEHVAILYGLNGLGKTTILRILDGLLSWNASVLRDIPFERVAMKFDNDVSLQITKEQSISSGEKPGHRYQLYLLKGGKQYGYLDWKAEDSIKGVTAIQQRHPYLRPLDDNYWEDITDGEIISTNEIQRRFGIDVTEDMSVQPVNSWLRASLPDVSVRLIDTQRVFRAYPRPPRGRNRHPSAPPDANSVSSYGRQLAQSIQQVLARYYEETQKLDQSFPSRLLSAMKTPQINSASSSQADAVNAKFAQVDEKRQRLRDAGLLQKEEDLVSLHQESPGEIQKLLNVYLSDILAKLSVFNDILARIELLKRIIDEHFRFKQLKISRDIGFEFLTDNGKSLSASKLSSGEQHIVILVYELLFVEQPGTLILIDEPEISLHISWQSSFLEDVERIAKINQNDVLIATHSPQIIGNRLDITQALEAPVESAR